MVGIVLEALQHSVESYFCSIGNEGKDGVVCVVINGVKDRFRQLFTKPLTFTIYIPVRATAKIDAFERTTGLSFLWQDLLLVDAAVFTYNQRLTGTQFINVLNGNIKSGLQDRPFTGYGNNPEPVKFSGSCCDTCNGKYVIPARFFTSTLK